MHRYVISLGSNVADAGKKLARAIEELGREFAVTAVSAVYTTAALNGVSPDYSNAVLSLESPLGIDEMVETLKRMEREAGRSATDKASGLVSLDLDIVIADDTVIRPRDFAQSYFQRGFAALD